MGAARSLHPSPRTLEVESLESFDRLVGAGARAMHDWHAQSLDLRGRGALLAAMDVQGAIFLGCTFDEGVEDSLRSRGALIFPRLEGVPFNPYRGQLYSPAELYAGIETSRYEDTLDARVYQWSIRPGQRHRLGATLAAALHDHLIGDALEKLTRSEPYSGHSIVGVMGGHAALRGTARFEEAAVLGRLLAQCNRVVATGGGPGIMEAANLGA